MTLQSALAEIGDKIAQFADAVDNEETTKDVLIRPMIQALGYDTSDPTQVRAEYPVKLGKSGRGRADYVLMQAGKPAIVMECKALGVELGAGTQGQMLQHARALGVYAGIVTDGDVYLCFGNVDYSRQIDSKPFRSVRLSQPTPEDRRALQPFSRAKLSAASLRSAAQRFRSEIDRRDDHVELFEAFGATQEVVRLADIAVAAKRKAAVDQTLVEMGRMLHEGVERIARGEIEVPGVQTTNEEIDAYMMCKGMLHGVIDPNRVSFRDLKTFASVIVDDNNRKPLCRFYFNGRAKSIGVMSPEKAEKRHAIDALDDMLQFATALRRTAKHYGDR